MRRNNDMVQIIKSQILLILLFTISACCAHSPLYNNDDFNQVGKIVLLFSETYGTGRMDETALITTIDFRDGLPGSVWVAEVWPKLKAYE